MIKRNKKGQFIKGNTIKLGFHHSDEAKRKMRLAKLGKKLTIGHKENIKKSMKGKNLNENNPSWKGDKVSYSGIHAWIRRHLGTPYHCELCERNNLKFYHWSNKSGEYKRDLKDWIRLCPSCHKKYDLSHNKTIFLNSCKNYNK